MNNSIWNTAKYFCCLSKSQTTNLSQINVQCHWGAQTHAYNMTGLTQFQAERCGQQTALKYIQMTAEKRKKTKYKKANKTAESNLHFQHTICPQNMASGWATFCCFTKSHCQKCCCPIVCSTYTCICIHTYMHMVTSALLNGNNLFAINSMLSFCFIFQLVPFVPMPQPDITSADNMSTAE